MNKINLGLLASCLLVSQLHGSFVLQPGLQANTLERVVGSEVAGSGKSISKYAAETQALSFSPNQFASIGTSCLGGNIQSISGGQPVYAQTADGAYVFKQSLAGSPNYYPAADYFFGDIILPPAIKPDGSPFGEGESGEDFYARKPLEPGQSILTASGSEVPVAAEADINYYYSVHSQRVYANTPGVVSIAWPSRLADESGHYSYLTQTYTISLGSQLPLRTVYWTEKGRTGPAISVPSSVVKAVNILYSSSFPQTVAREYRPIDYTEMPGQTEATEEKRTLWYSNLDGMLHAYNKTGRVLVEWLGDKKDLVSEERVHLGVDVVDVKQEAGINQVTAYLGEVLSPGNADNDLVPEKVFTASSGQQNFVFQSVDAAGKTLFYAERETEYLSDVLIYWMRMGVLGIYWPERLDGYWLEWPEDWSEYAINVQGAYDPGNPTATSTQIPLLNNAQLVFQDDPNGVEANIDLDSKFVTNLGEDQRNRALIRMTKDGNVYYARVLTANENTAGFPNYAETTATVGARIEAPATSDSLAGYIVESTGNAYHPVAYKNPFAVGFDEAAKGAIIPVNALSDNRELEVWWFTKSVDLQGNLEPIYWPSYIRKYTIAWPTDAREIVLASNSGSGELSALEAAGTIYRQNDDSLAGYNPNEEHALMLAGRAYALRDDLNVWTLGGDQRVYSSSPPFVLIDYKASDNRPAMAVFRVLRETDSIKFNYDAMAGTQLQSPMPLPLLPIPLFGDATANKEISTETTDAPLWWSETGASTYKAIEPFKHYGKYTFVDRKNAHWVYRGYHDPENPGEALKMQYYYNSLESFDYPSLTAPEVGAIVAYLRAYVDPADPNSGFVGDAIGGAPLTIEYNPVWPTMVPELRVGETLTAAKYGLPAVRGNTSAQVLYQQSQALTMLPADIDGKRSVTLFDPTRVKTYALSALPASIATTTYQGKTYFEALPPSLIKRLYYDPMVGSAGALVLKGEFMDEPVGEDYLMLNVLTAAEIAVIKGICDAEDALLDNWEQAVDGLKTKLELFVEDAARKGTFIVNTTEDIGITQLAEIDNDDIAVDSYALAAAKGVGTGYVTMVFGNGEAFTPVDEAVALQIFKVTPPLYRGELKVILADNPLNEKVSLRHTADFAAKPEDYNFEWKYLPPVNGANPPLYDETRVLLVDNGTWDLARWPDANLPSTSAYTADAVTLANNSAFVINDGTSSNGNDPDVVLHQSVTVAAQPLKSYFSINMGSYDGFILYINGVRTLAYKTPDAGDEENGMLVSLPSLYSPLSRIFEVNSRNLVAGNNQIEIALFTESDPQTSYPLEVRLEASVEVDRSDEWIALTPADGMAAHTYYHTISGSSILTLTDNYVTMRYQAKNAANATFVDDGSGNNTHWSRWMEPQLVEGWIKRVLAGINPFNQRVSDFYNNEVNTDTSIIQQAGKRWEGDIALSLDSINDFGLIEIYETVLGRGKSLSIDGTPSIDYGPANDALLLAAGYLNDLYMALGNEAYADALNPTISFDANSGEIGAESTSLFAFKGQMATLMDEELGLLRGRDNGLQPGVEIAPVYNRLFWNYTRGIDSGEVVYALNYNIREKSGIAADGKVDAADAATLYPQAHGDAYGHYLTALKNYYKLLTDAEFSWGPRTEAVTILGKAVQVDYMDERKFATAAASVAKTADYIVSLVRRGSYIEDESSGWGHLQDSRDGRYWGLDDWATRGIQGAYYNWVVANALLPETDPNPNNEGIMKIDRTTVPELDEIPLSAQAIQIAIDEANMHMNPLGLPPGSVAFDISPTELANGKAHFEQIFERSIRTLGNAASAFERASRNAFRLRDQEVQTVELQQSIVEQEAAFTDRLIELYGMPYSGDIGVGKTYSQDYAGPDLLKFMYIDKPMYFDNLEEPSEFYLYYDQSAVEGQETKDISHIQTLYEYTEDSDGFIKLESDDQQLKRLTYTFTPGALYQLTDASGVRRSIGTIQESLYAVFRAEYAFKRALAESSSIWEAAKSDFAAARERIELSKELWEDKDAALGHIHRMQRSITSMNITQAITDLILDQNDKVSETIITGLPTILGLSSDVTSAARAAVGATAFAWELPLKALNLAMSSSVMTMEQIITEMQDSYDLQLEGIAVNDETAAALDDFSAAVGDLLATMDTIDLAHMELMRAKQNYQRLLAQGDQILAERESFRKRAAALVQGFRTRDLAFRLFRNEALEQYRTLFETASRYSYLAAQAYDYETGLLGNAAGKAFLNDIVKARSLGAVIAGQPQFTGSASGDPGLSSRLAELDGDWQAVKTRLGFNNPDQYGTTLSLRYELLRIANGVAGDDAWKQALDARYLNDILVDPDVAQHCMQVDPGTGEPVPGFIIEFSGSIERGKNFFGHDYLPTDHAFSVSNFATKLYSVGVAFRGYVGMDPLGYYIPGEEANPIILSNEPDALGATPYVYLIPCGKDTMRTPPLGDASSMRTWSVHDYAVPLPFDIGNQDSSDDFWTSGRSLDESIFSPRKHQAFRAVDLPWYFYFDEDLFTNKRLVGRSAWNSKWKIIIPTNTLHYDSEEAKTRFLRSVTDILLHMRTYSYSGN